VFREDYHLTLQFLGECTREQTGRIIAALTDLAKCQKPFALQIQGIGSFGRPEQPRILWAGVTGELDALHLLQRQVTERLSHIGFPPEDRPYRPHITLARKCQQTGFPSRDLAVFQPVEEAKAGWTVGEIVLYETRFGQTPMYHAVQHFPFGERVG
jgi:2'-5' RNA ligase